MDDTFLIGSAAFLSSIIVFVGSVWLLLALVMGPRLSYLVTASVTLGFVLIMAVVWSIGTPLGPVGDLPTFEEVDIGEDPAALEFGPAASYPEGDWHAPDEENEEETARAAELETAAADFLDARIETGEITSYDSAADTQVAQDSVRFLEQDDTLYGALTLEPIPAEGGASGAEGGEAGEGNQVVAVMSFDPGNPNAPARRIALGTFVLFVGHLWFLGRAEKKAKRKEEADEEGTTS